MIEKQISLEGIIDCVEDDYIIIKTKNSLKKLEKMSSNSAVFAEKRIIFSIGFCKKNVEKTESPPNAE